jgi:hypothetical protein
MTWSITDPFVTQSADNGGYLSILGPAENRSKDSKCLPARNLAHRPDHRASTMTTGCVS